MEYSNISAITKYKLSFINLVNLNKMFYYFTETVMDIKKFAVLANCVSEFSFGRCNH